jgi:class 3 adenylate cyclase
MRDILEMGLKSELEGKVNEIFKTRWTTRDGTVVPDSADVGLGNDAVKLSSAVVLYADLVESTDLVESQAQAFAAEIYKTYLHCCAKIIRSESGDITAYDGDRIMSVFLGDYRNTRAARCALKMNYAVKEIINPGITKVYTTQTYKMKHAIGIDSSDLFVARTGIRGSNDLVWVGTAANNAAKLSGLREGYVTWISESVYKNMTDDGRLSGDKNMWTERSWKGKTVYASNWTWEIG